MCSQGLSSAGVRTGSGLCRCSSEEELPLLAAPGLQITCQPGDNLDCIFDTIIPGFSLYFHLFRLLCLKIFFWGQVKIMQERHSFSLKYKDSLCVYVWSSSPSSAKEWQATPNLIWSLLPLDTILKVSEAVEWVCTRASLCIISLWSQWCPVMT